jgi:transcription elongation factor GreA
METVTKADKEQLEARLKALVHNRGAISARIAEARSHGDLKENGDYHAAKDQQGMEEAEIRNLQERLSQMIVMDERLTKALAGTVLVGSMVKLRDEKDGEVETYKLVGEASPVMPPDYVEVTQGSAMGQALLKAKVGETIRVDAPRGVKQFTIVEIV